MFLRFILLAAALLTFQFSIPAQTGIQTNAVEPATHKNSAIIPKPRKGRIATRQALVLQRAKDNQGDCDVELIGDSITQGWERGGQKAWHDHFGNIKVLNFGVYGDEIQNVLWRIAQGQLDGIKPKVAIVLIGTNNSNGNSNTPEEIVEGIQAIVNEIHKRQPGTKVLVLGVFPRGTPTSPERSKVEHVDQLLAHLDDEKTDYYMDLGSIFLGSDNLVSKDLVSDGIHPNAAGYELWAKTMEPKLKELLASK
jgi:lysophospholipase L1-like esterase